MNYTDNFVLERDMLTAKLKRKIYVEEAQAAQLLGGGDI